MAFGTLILLFGFMFGELAHPESVNQMAPIVVEADSLLGSEPSTHPSLIQETTSPIFVGKGAKVFDVPQTVEGIPLWTLEREESLLQVRPLEESQLRKKGPVHISGTIGPYQSFQGYHQTQNTEFSAGVYRNHHPASLWSDNRTTYDRGDDHVVSIPRFRDHSFFHGSFQKSFLKTTIETDQEKRSELLGSNHLGTIKNQEASGKITARTTHFRLTPFARWGSQRFSADPSIDLASSSGKFVTGGAVTEAKLQDTPFIFRVMFEKENWDRQIINPEDSLSFSRTTAQPQIYFQYLTSPWFEYRSDIKFTNTSDHNKETKTLYQNWSTAHDLSSSHQFPWGWSVQGERKILLPKPTQVFGNGSGLEPGFLPPETGLRSSTGPWIETAYFSGSTKVFAEETKNVPIQKTTSPYSAKSFPIARVWTRGISTTSETRTTFLSWANHYTYQQALNDSENFSERGNDIPDRPRHDFTSTLKGHYKFWETGTSYHYQSSTARDLVGIKYSPRSFEVSYFLGFQSHNFRVRGEILNLWASDLTSSLQTGEYSTDAFGQPIKERTFLLRWEANL